MKYRELRTEKARAICKKYKLNCEKCTLRRTRIQNEKYKTLFCWYILIDFYNTQAEEFIDLMNEEIDKENLRQLQIDLEDLQDK